MDKSVGTVYIEFEAKLEKLRAELAAARAEAAQAGQAIGTSVGGGMNKTAAASEGVFSSVRGVQRSLQSTIGAVTRLAGMIGAMVGTVYLIGRGISEWVTSAERAAKTIDEMSKSSGDSLQKAIIARVRAESELAGKSPADRADAEIAAIKEQQKAETQAIREKISNNEEYKKIAEEIKSVQKELNSLTDPARVARVSRIPELKKGLDDWVAFYTEKLDALKSKERGMFALFGGKELEEKIKTANALAESARLRAAADQKKIDDEERARREKMLENERRIMMESAKEFAKEIYDAFEPLRDAVTQFSQLSGSDKVGISAQFIAQRLATTNRILKDISNQQSTALASRGLVGEN